MPATDMKPRDGQSAAPAILIVEDEAVVALDLERTLESLGYRVVGKASSGEEATRMAAELAPDLVLMDIHLDGTMDGIDAAREVRRLLGVPVVFLTAYADDQTIERAKRIGPHGYVLKPFEARDLRSTVEIAIHAHGVEHELQSSNENLKAILDAQRNGTIRVDTDGRVTFASRAAKRMLGRTAGDLLGVHWRDALPLPRAAIRRLESVLEAPASVPPERRRMLSVDIPDPAGSASSLDVEVRQDPRSTGAKMLFLYDVSELKGLRKILDEKSVFERIVARSEPMESVFHLIQDIAPVDVPVLIEGETGTGKELVARAIHRRSHRHDKPFVAVNCGGLSEELSLSQLFGHRRGAFTGAVSDHTGVFEQAHEGTLFLDEVGDLPARVQTMLLRVLEEKVISRVGGSRTRLVDVRVIAAANRQLAGEVERGKFRADLLYRLQVARIGVPPLRERREDISLLARTFIDECRARTGKPVEQISSEALRMLVAHEWPGNVRELKNAVEFAMLRCRNSFIGVDDLPSEIAQPAPAASQGDEPALMRAALADANGNRMKAAKILGISRATLYRRLAKYGIE